MRQVVWVAIVLAGGWTGSGSASAQNISCNDVFRACQRWCYSERSGPEMFLCKSNCQTEFNSSLNSGIFRREDGASIECQAVPNVVWRDRPKWSLPAPG